MLFEKICFNDPRWDTILDETKSTYVYYRSSYIAAFRDMNHYIPMMILCTDGNTQAVSVYFKRDISMDSHFKGEIPENTYYDLVSPYGYGGYVGNVENEAIYDEHHNFCRHCGFVSEVIKFHPISRYAEFYKGTIDSPFHNVVRTLEDPIDNIWMNFKQKVRKNVKKAERNGVRIIRESDLTHLEDFIRIYYGTMSRNGANEDFYFSKSFFETISNMNRNIMFFYAIKDNKIISTELVLYDSESCYSYLGGTDQSYYEYRPNDYLKYEIIKWGKEKGLRNFVLGGGHGADDGIFNYKASLAPDGIVDFYVGTDVFNTEIYKKLCDIRMENDKSYSKVTHLVPEYRN